MTTNVLKLRSKSDKLKLSYVHTHQINVFATIYECKKSTRARVLVEFCREKHFVFQIYQTEELKKNNNNNNN